MIKLKQILTLMILYAMCLLAKNLAYCAIIIFVLVLPIKKVIKNNKKSLPIISTILIIAMLVCATLMVNKLFTAAADGGERPAAAGDRAGVVLRPARRDRG